MLHSRVRGSVTNMSCFMSASCCCFFVFFRMLHIDKSPETTIPQRVYHHATGVKQAPVTEGATMRSLAQVV